MQHKRIILRGNRFFQYFRTSTYPLKEAASIMVVIVRQFCFCELRMFELCHLNQSSLRGTSTLRQSTSRVCSFRQLSCCTRLNCLHVVAKARRSLSSRCDRMWRQILSL